MKNLHYSKHWIWSGLLALPLLVGLACNLPLRQPTVEEIVEESLRGTLQAQVFATMVVTLTPLPPGMPTPTPYELPPVLPELPTGYPTTTPAQDPPQGMLPTSVPPTPTAPPPPPEGAPAVFLYRAQSGDTLSAVAQRFAVSLDQMTPAQAVEPNRLLPPGMEIEIPNVLGEVPYPTILLPDSEVIYSPSTAGFSIESYIASAGGYLNEHTEWADGKQRTGAEIVRLVAEQNSTNPRILLGVLEFRSGWVLGHPAGAERNKYPLGFHVGGHQGLYLELSLAAKMLNMGYYGWREGTFTELKFADGEKARFSPELNAGTVAIQNMFAKLYKSGPWLDTLYGNENFVQVYSGMFGNPWERATAAEPLLPDGLEQPWLELPFQPGERWSLTGGPHLAWITGTPVGALDFAPVTGEPACSVSRAWVTASAPGLVLRAEGAAVLLDLDGDGNEGTGWVLLYMHIAERDRVQPGTYLNLDDRIGHPSCEGGSATGSHVHFARKYNGEWLPAESPVPIVLSGWQAQNGARKYQGFLVKGEQVVTAHTGGGRRSIIVR